MAGDLLQQVRQLERDLETQQANYGTLLERWRASCDDLAIFRAEHTRMAATLQAIAGQDYRGNRPHSADIAETALKTITRGEA